MDRDRQHIGVVGVERLDAVTVMDVEVDIQHTETRPASEGDGKRRVVVDAKPRGVVPHRVVEPAARMECVGGIAVEDRLHRGEGTAGDGGGGIVHFLERRVVAPAPDPGLRRAVRIDR